MQRITRAFFIGRARLRNRESIFGRGRVSPEGSLAVRKTRLNNKFESLERTCRFFSDDPMYSLT